MSCLPRAHGDAFFCEQGSVVMCGCVSLPANDGMMLCDEPHLAAFW